MAQRWPRWTHASFTVDQPETGRHAKPLSGSSREWRGAAWLAVGLLVGSGTCELLKSPDHFPLSDYAFSEHNLLPMLFIIFLALAGSSFRRWALGIWFAAACITMLIAVGELPWGDTIDASPVSERQYFIYSQLGDALLAFGSTILFIASIALIRAEWQGQRGPVSAANAVANETSLSTYSSAWLGAAWTGVAAHFAAALCRALRFRSDFPIWNYVQPADYIVPCIFALFVLGYYRRFRRPLLALWLVLAAFCLFVAGTDQWGETLVHGDDAAKRQFHGYGFLSSGLFAFGSAVLLAANLALIWGEWARRRSG